MVGFPETSPQSELRILDGEMPGTVSTVGVLEGRWRGDLRLSEIVGVGAGLATGGVSARWRQGWGIGEQGERAA